MMRQPFPILMELVFLPISPGRGSSLAPHCLQIPLLRYCRVCLLAVLQLLDGLDISFWLKAGQSTDRPSLAGGRKYRLFLSVHYRHFGFPNIPDSLILEYSFSDFHGEAPLLFLLPAIRCTPSMLLLIALSAFVYSSCVSTFSASLLLLLIIAFLAFLCFIFIIVSAEVHSMWTQQHL